MQIVIDIPEEQYNIIKSDLYNTFSAEMKIWGLGAIRNGIPFQEICDSEISEIKNEVKDLSKRVEILEKQIKEDKEEQLKKLEAELNYAKFRCALPTIIDMMRYN